MNMAVNSIATIVAQTPAVVLIDVGKRDDLYAHIRQEIDAFEPDLTTTKGRDAIKALSFKITRTKTAIDAAGKKLNEDARAQINVVDAARRDARETLDRMAGEVRQPLTEWEEAEDARKLRISGLLTSIAAMANVAFENSAADIAERMERVRAITFSTDDFREDVSDAEEKRARTLATLQAAHDRLAREEADRAELERLRAEAAERERVEAERRAAEEVERQRAEAERVAEERRVAAEQAEAERIRKVQEAAAQAARDEEVRKARAVQEERDRQHAEALAAERAKVAEVERQQKAEADRIAQIERERLAAEEAAKAEAARAAAEQSRREKSRAHRGTVMGEVKAAIMSCGVDEPIAKAIVLAIVAGTVPHTTIQF